MRSLAFGIFENEFYGVKHFFLNSTMCKIGLYLFSFMLFFSAATAIKTYHINGEAQGTTYHITYYAKDSIVSKSAIELLLKELDNSLSTYHDHSIISEFNQSTEGTLVDNHLRKVVEKSLEVYKETNGIFDITASPLIAAWGFGSKGSNKVPDSAKISSLMQCVGAHKIRLIKNRLIKNNPCIKLDVDGIAQGYSVDVLADFLERKDINNYLVEIG
ncbi:MAG: FAD:protein FMN transferase, partial [Chryseobacterium sp.]